MHCCCTAVCSPVNWLFKSSGKPRRVSLCLLTQETDPWCCCADVLEGVLLEGRHSSISQLCRLSTAKWSCQVSVVLSLFWLCLQF